VVLAYTAGLIDPVPLAFDTGFEFVASSTFESAFIASGIAVLKESRGAYAERFPGTVASTRIAVSSGGSASRAFDAATRAIRDTSVEVPGIAYAVW
jgi:hypothetical protein